MISRLYLLALALLLGLAACTPDPPTYTLDQSALGKIRHEYFLECLRLLPAGPTTAKYNDWDDVVDSCNSAAYQQAYQTCEFGCPLPAPTVESAP